MNNNNKHGQVARNVPPPDSLSELASLVVADVAGRRADEAVHTVGLEELGHVKAHEHLLVVEELPAPNLRVKGGSYIKIWGTFYEE